MTKTLTEQWKDGKLEKGTYWCVSSWTDEIRMFYFEGDYFIDCDVPLDDDNIEEVLAPVPSYDEYKEPTQRVGRLELDNEVLEDVVQECNKRGLENKKLQEQLKIATKALEDCYNDMKYWAVLTHRNQRILGVIKKALKEMEGVK